MVKTLTDQEIAKAYERGLRDHLAKVCALMTEAYKQHGIRISFNLTSEADTQVTSVSALSMTKVLL